MSFRCYREGQLGGVSQVWMWSPAKNPGSLRFSEVDIAKKKYVFPEIGGSLAFIGTPKELIDAFRNAVPKSEEEKHMEVGSGPIFMGIARYVPGAMFSRSFSWVWAPYSIRRKNRPGSNGGIGPNGMVAFLKPGENIGSQDKLDPSLEYYIRIGNDTNRKILGMTQIAEKKLPYECISLILEELCSGPMPS